MLNHFRLTDCFEILDTYVDLGKMQYFDDLEELKMTTEEVEELGNGYSYESRIGGVGQ